MNTTMNIKKRGLRAAVALGATATLLVGVSTVSIASKPDHAVEQSNKSRGGGNTPAPAGGDPCATFAPGANLSGCDLSYVPLAQLDLSGADLRGADLSYADLSGVNLVGADLRGTTFVGADLTGADLTDALVNGGTNFETADTSRAIGLG